MISEGHGFHGYAMCTQSARSAYVVPLPPVAKRRCTARNGIPPKSAIHWLTLPLTHQF